jgi:hypothetical protein
MVVYTLWQWSPKWGACNVPWGCMLNIFTDIGLCDEKSLEITALWHSSYI